MNEASPSQAVLVARFRLMGEKARDDADDALFSRLSTSLLYRYWARGVSMNLQQMLLNL